MNINPRSNALICLGMAIVCITLSNSTDLRFLYWVGNVFSAALGWHVGCWSAQLHLKHLEKKWKVAK